MTFDEKEMRELLQKIVDRAHDTTEDNDIHDLNDCINNMLNLAEEYLRRHQ